MGSAHRTWRLYIFCPGVFVLAFSACAKKTDAPPASSCPVVTGSPWVPAVTGVGAENHDAAVTVSQTVLTATGPITGFAQAAPSSKEISVTFPMMEDLGVNGSLSLIATVEGVAAGRAVYPMLVSLTDNATPTPHEFINLARGGAGSDCAASGYFTTSGTRSPSCTIAWPSAYFDREHWEQHWLQPASNAPSIDTFPTCSWSNGLDPAQSNPYSQPACPFNTGASGFLDSQGKLVHGTNYTAKYLLLSGDSSSVTNGATATLQLTVVKKTDSGSEGAIDANVILVGSKNVQASRTAKGQLNLNTLFSNISDIYAQAGVKLGNIRVYEWGCDGGGDAYANLDTSDIYEMFGSVGSLLPASATGVNLFFISSFTDSSATLGISGAIGGPFSNGTALSGVAVATLDLLESYNPDCTGSSCPMTSQDVDFRQLGPTVAHEMGHFLGLNHPSESPYNGTQTHDVVYDTPICTKTSANGSVSISSCLSDTNSYVPTSQTCSAACTGYNGTSVFCPAQLECQFNHLMFRTSKHYVAGSTDGDGNLISSNAAGIINFHPLVQ